MALPKIFVGSSSEGKHIASAIRSNLADLAEVIIWHEGVFGLNENYLESLLNALDNFQYAIFVFSPDDAVKIRNQDMVTTRDNVVFETGLFMGRLGKDKVFFVAPSDEEDFRLLSDFSGITIGKYRSNYDNLVAATAEFCDKVKEKLNNPVNPGNSLNFRVILKGVPIDFTRSGKDYECIAKVEDDDFNERIIENVRTRWEVGGFTAILQDVLPNEQVKIIIKEIGSNKKWESRFFPPYYLNTELELLQND